MSKNKDTDNYMKIKTLLLIYYIILLNPLIMSTFNYLTYFEARINYTPMKIIFIIF
jgi:hypothetical protein